jgi:Cu2+-exporting ATPase
VVAGAIVLDTSVRVELTQVGDNSTVGQIKQLVAQAQQSKPKSQQLADRAAKWLTFVALMTSLLTLLVWGVVIESSLVTAITLAITVLVIACPHALGLAIPAVVTIGTRMALDHGLFIKDLTKIEQIKDVDYVVFDKTGTLTQGEFKVQDFEVVVDDLSQDLALAIAVSLEKQSSHVIAQSIVAYGQEQSTQQLAVKKFKTLPGFGVSGQVEKEHYYLGNFDLVKKHDLEATVPDQFLPQQSTQT